MSARCPACAERLAALADAMAWLQQRKEAKG